MSSFEQLKTMCDSTLATLPDIDYDSRRKEIISYGISRAVTSSPHELSDEMASIQASKDRMFEVVHEAQRNHSVRKKVAELLFDAAITSSVEKSQDKRKGEASASIGRYILDAAEADSFMRFCFGALKNLDSKHDTVSRRITCMQMTVKMQDSGREGIIRDTSPENTKGLFDSSEENTMESVDSNQIDRNSIGFTDW